MFNYGRVFELASYHVDCVSQASFSPTKPHIMIHPRHGIMGTFASKAGGKDFEAWVAAASHLHHGVLSEMRKGGGERARGESLSLLYLYLALSTVSGQNTKS